MRLRVQQQAELDHQREEMQKEIMRLLHEQVTKYWLLARMCNDVIIHASTSGFFLYLSAECKAALGYPPPRCTACTCPMPHAPCPMPHGP